MSLDWKITSQALYPRYNVLSQKLVLFLQSIHDLERLFYPRHNVLSYVQDILEHTIRVGLLKAQIKVKAMFWHKRKLSGRQTVES
jgi:hypothetical protein